MANVTLEVASADNAWHRSVNNGITPLSYLMEFGVTREGWGVLLNYYGDTLPHYRVGISESYQPEILLWNPGTGSYDVVMRLPANTSLTAGNVQVVNQSFVLGDSMGGSPWRGIALFFNRQLIVAHAAPELDLSTPTGTYAWGTRAEPGYGLAFYASTANFVFEGFRIPELTEFCHWTSLDPNEPPAGGMSRAIEGRYVKFFLRPNTALRAWIPKFSLSQRVYDWQEIDGHELNVDTRAVITHVRQHGAYVYADYVDHDLADEYGYNYAELNNPYLMDEAECRRQAILSVQRSVEEAVSEDFSSEYNPLLEPEDHITSPTGERVINGIDVQYQPAVTMQKLSLRSYTHGS